MKALFNLRRRLHLARAWLRHRSLQARGVRLAWPVRIDRMADFEAGVNEASCRGRIVADRHCHIAQGAILHAYGGSISLGEHVFVGPYSVIYGHGGVQVGPHTLIAMHCRIVSSNHAIPPAGQCIRDLPDIKLPTKIGRDVWLGAGVTVLGGVTIGDGCVVGAGAVVTADIPPYSVSVGIPARVVGHRPFSAHDATKS